MFWNVYGIFQISLWWVSNLIQNIRLEQKIEVRLSSRNRQFDVLQCCLAGSTLGFWKLLQASAIPYLHLSPMIKEKYQIKFRVDFMTTLRNHTEVIEANSHPIFIYPTAKHRTWKYKHVFQIFVFSYDIVMKWECRFFRPTNLYKLFQKEVLCRIWKQICQNVWSN